MGISQEIWGGWRHRNGLGIAAGTILPVRIPETEPWRLVWERLGYGRHVFPFFLYIKKNDFLTPDLTNHGPDGTRDHRNPVRRTLLYRNFPRRAHHLPPDPNILNAKTQKLKKIPFSGFDNDQSLRLTTTSLGRQERSVWGDKSDQIAISLWRQRAIGLGRQVRSVWGEDADPCGPGCDPSRD